MNIYHLEGFCRTLGRFTADAAKAATDGCFLGDAVGEGPPEDLRSAHTADQDFRATTTPVAWGTVPVAACVAWAVGMIAIGGVAGELAPGSDPAWQHWIRAGVAVLLAGAATLALARQCVRRFGGITGDVLGAACELATAAALLALSTA